MSARGAHRRTSITELLRSAVDGAEVTVTGWVKTSRFSKNVSFVHLYDGSSPATVQVVLKGTSEELNARLNIGAALKVQGTWVASVGGKQAWEIKPHDDGIEVVGDSDAAVYPLQKKRTSLENLRTMPHLRPRTNTFQSLFRVRHQVAFEIHRFFHERGFLWIHTPIITASDAEGAGEQFAVQSGPKPESFFGQKTFLTVSGQLEVEPFASAYTDVYTFGPTFRAENSHTPRHASEFWMIEPEMAFADLDDVIALAEEFVKTVGRATMEALPEDFVFFDKFVEKGLLDSLNAVLEADFARVTWHDAQDILASCGKTFEFPIGEGTHLQSEHERYLAEEHFKSPVFITHYPADQKPFYMFVNEGDKTVSAVDLIVPRVGELIGGSQREHRLDVLDRRMTEAGMDLEAYDWYRDLRRFGTTPHGGFGLGFERLLMWLTGMQNIRDVLPYPRVPGNTGFM